MAAIDVAGFVADLKDHAIDHGFHVHDERHFVETYSLRQAWEVDLHPEDGCGGPVDLHISLDVDPRALLAFEDALLGLPDDVDPPDEFHFPLVLTWSLPPLAHGPDLLRLAIDLAPVGGLDLPLEVTAIDTFASATDGSERRISIIARHPISLAEWPRARIRCAIFLIGVTRSAISSYKRRSPGLANCRTCGPSCVRPSDNLKNRWRKFIRKPRE